MPFTGILRQQQPGQLAQDHALPALGSRLLLLLLPLLPPLHVRRAPTSWHPPPSHSQRVTAATGQGLGNGRKEETDQEMIVAKKIP